MHGNFWGLFHGVGGVSYEMLNMVFNDAISNRQTRQNTVLNTTRTRLQNTEGYLMTPLPTVEPANIVLNKTKDTNGKH